AIGFGGWYWYKLKHRPVEAPAVARAVTPPPAPAPEPQVQHPIGTDSAAGAEALPGLNDSDAVVHDSLAGVIGRHPVEEFPVPQNIVRHVVATVDNLTRRKVAIDLRPVKPTAGAAVVATQGEITTLGDANFARYAPLVKVIQGTDMKALALVYQRLYPLF